MFQFPPDAQSPRRELESGPVPATLIQRLHRARQNTDVPLDPAENCPAAEYQTPVGRLRDENEFNADRTNARTVRGRGGPGEQSGPSAKLQYLVITLISSIKLGPQYCGTR